MALVNAGDRLLYVEFDSSGRSNKVTKRSTEHNGKIGNEGETLTLKEACETINENNKGNCNSSNNEIKLFNDAKNNNGENVIDTITDIVQSLCYIYGFVNRDIIERNNSSLNRRKCISQHNQIYRHKHTFTPSLYKNLIKEYSSTFGIISGFDRMLLMPLLFCAHDDDSSNNGNNNKNNNNNNSGKSMNESGCTYIEDLMLMLWLEDVECLRFIRVHPSQVC